MGKYRSMLEAAATIAVAIALLSIVIPWQEAIMVVALGAIVLAPVFLQLRIKLQHAWIAYQFRRSMERQQEQAAQPKEAPPMQQQITRL